MMHSRVQMLESQVVERMSPRVPQADLSAGCMLRPTTMDLLDCWTGSPGVLAVLSFQMCGGSRGAYRAPAVATAMVGGGMWAGELGGIAFCGSLLSVLIHTSCCGLLLIASKGSGCEKGAPGLCLAQMLV